MDTIGTDRPTQIPLIQVTPIDRDVAYYITQFADYQLKVKGYTDIETIRSGDGSITIVGRPPKTRSN